ncbi:hypothetical protein PJP12_29465, partial [Mycobacterium kansasii]
MKDKKNKFFNHNTRDYSGSPVCTQLFSNSHTKSYSTPNILTQGILAFTNILVFTGSPKTFTIVSL